MTKRFCTVVTDASWCPHERVAGWAAWLVCDGNRHKQYGAFKETVASSTEAEVKAILNGLYLARKRYDAQHYHVVSDCVGAMLKLQNALNWRHELEKIVGTSRVTFKHVKAHTRNTDARSYVNNWCDVNAKTAMWSQRTGKGVDNV